MVKSQIRVENSIQDVKEMIIARLGDRWKREWVEEVQGLLERDAGWGWGGFWECVKRNLDARLLSPSSFLDICHSSSISPVF